MLWALIASFAMLIGNEGQSPAQPALNSDDISNRQPSPNVIAANHPSKPTPSSLGNTAPPSPDENLAAENELLQLANESRQQVGLQPLHPDAGLTDAAREHARLMAANGQLSHQYAGEAALLQRIEQASSLRLDRAGENVAYNSDAHSAHDALMHSPPHRENLLDAGFNVAGIAAIWSGGHLYIVEDFAHQIPAYSAQQTRQLVVRGVNEIRSRAGLPQLRQISSSSLDTAVCSLARQNRVSARPLNVAYPSREIITYTQSRPEILPQSAVHLLKGRSLRQVVIGTCYASNTKYPSGMYWVAILLY